VLNAFGGFHSPGVARSLGRLGIDVYGLYGRPGAAQASRFYRRTDRWSVDGDGANALEELRRLRSRLATPPLLVPEDDISLGFVESHAEELRREFLFPERAPGLAERLSNKQGMYELCVEHGIPTPLTVFPTSRPELEEALGSFTFPIVLKGIDGARLKTRIGATMVIVGSERELLDTYGQLEADNGDNLMLQEYIPGTPESVWMFDAYFDRDSACRFGITGQKIRQYPPYTGMTSLGICVDNERVKESASALMAAVGYRGPLDCGFRHDARDDAYKLLDVNPRLGASFRLFVADNDLDVVRSMYLDLTGQQIPAWRAVAKRKWVAESSDLVSSTVYWRNGELRARDWVRSFRGVRETAWFARDDLRPALRMVWRLLLPLAAKLRRR
jgi:D-aspartate ligase